MVIFHCHVSFQGRYILSWSHAGIFQIAFPKGNSSSNPSVSGAMLVSGGVTNFVRRSHHSQQPTVTGHGDSGLSPSRDDGRGSQWVSLWMGASRDQWESKMLLMGQKSSDQQLRLVVYLPQIYRVLAPQVVGNGISEPSTVSPKNLRYLRMEESSPYVSCLGTAYESLNSRK